MLSSTDSSVISIIMDSTLNSSNFSSGWLSACSRQRGCYIRNIHEVTLYLISTSISYFKKHKKVINHTNFKDCLHPNFFCSLTYDMQFQQQLIYILHATRCSISPPYIDDICRFIRDYEHKSQIILCSKTKD